MSAVIGQAGWHRLPRLLPFARRAGSHARTALGPNLGVTPVGPRRFVGFLLSREEPAPRGPSP